MSVELVATKNSHSMSLETFPAVIGQGAGSVEVSESMPGSYHCLLSLADSQLLVWDLGTPGGTFVNGSRVSRAALKPGDTLKLGGMEFQVNSKPRLQRYLRGLRS